VAAVQQSASRDLNLEGWAHALIDGIDDALFIHDLSGRILEANPAACQRLGYTREEMLGLTTRDIDDPSFAAGFDDRINQQMNRGQFRCEGRHRTKDGRVIAVDINTSAIHFEGKPAVLALMRDITQRKAMEDALRQQSELFQSILDNMGDGVMVADEYGQILVCNPGARRLFGLTDKTRQFPPDSPDFKMLLPDRVTPCPREQMPLARALQGEDVDEAELFVRHAQAPEGRWLSVTGRPLCDAQSGARGGILVCRDITGRKRAEARQATQYAVTRALDECADLEAAAPVILRYICEGIGWDLGVLWLVDGVDKVLRCQSVWHKPEAKYREFAEATRQTTFAPGKGLPGRSWSSQHSSFMPDVTVDPNFVRSPQARAVGLKAALAFPIRSGGETVGVIEAFHHRLEQPDPGLLALMGAMGSQLGQVLERQRVQKALRESEAFYHSLVENLPQNIYRKDKDGRITFGNGRYCKTLGKSLPELLGKSDFDLFPEHLARKYTADDAKVMQGGKTFEAVEAHHLPDGTDLYVQVIKTPMFDEHGQIIGTQGVFWDVTERKRSEEAVAASERRYRQLTEATQDAIVVADREGRITLFNPAAERLFGYAAGEVVGLVLDALLPDATPGEGEAGESIRHLLAQRQATTLGRPVEMHGRKKDGTTFPVELALSVIDGAAAGGNHVQFLAAIRDLTERNRIRAVLVQNEKLASIGLLSAGVAHEINNPLAFVANNLAVLERDNKGIMEVLDRYHALLPQLHKAAPAEAAQLAACADEVDIDYIRDNLCRLLSRTREGVDRVTRIVHSLRGLARTDSPKRMETSIPDLVETSLDILRGRMKQQNIGVCKTYDPDSSVLCVQTQISQVLLNLLVNALQAIEAAGRDDGRITVLTQRLGEDMLIEVGDNGTGIAPDHLAKLFDPFFTTKDVGEGTGLGLSIAHNIIRAHGGRIEVDSQVGVGTRFRIYLPLHASGGAS
jgi:two-component system, NtrC family, sensor kinase